MMEKYLGGGIRSALLAVLTAFGVSSAGTLVLQDLDYTDHKQSFYTPFTDSTGFNYKNYHFNPDRGFYEPQVIHLKPSGTAPFDPWCKQSHMRAEISAFSSNACWKDDNSPTGKTCGVSQDLTDDALNVLRQSFDNVRKKNGTVIVRITYDPWYNGISNVTPSQNLVLSHLKQLAPVLSDYTDVITAFELGTYGAFGEMHSDTMATLPNESQAIQTLMRNTPQDLKIISRTAPRIAKALGFDNYGVDFNIDSEVFKQKEAVLGDTLYRLGMFNDGYLGTQIDWGSWGGAGDCATSICREEGVAWLEKYGINTPYGGEATQTPEGWMALNTAEYLSYEGFRTHTSYLNVQHDYGLITYMWKKNMLQFEDLEYNGEDTDFKYINDHLGYRYVLRQSSVVDSVRPGGKFQANLKIQNVGFGNMVRAMKTTLVLRPDEVDWKGATANNSLVVELSTPIDIQSVHSRSKEWGGADTLEKNTANGSNMVLRKHVIPKNIKTTFDGVNDVAVEVTIPEEINSAKIPQGKWKAYLRISGKGDYATDNNFHCVLFANTPEYVDSLTMSNYIGSFVVSEEASEESSSSEGMESSSSVEEGSSSSEQEESSSSAAEEFIPSIAVYKNLRLSVANRSVQIAGAPVGKRIALLDMQGRVLYAGQIATENFSVMVPNSGRYIVRIGNATQVVNVR